MRTETNKINQTEHDQSRIKYREQLIVHKLNSPDNGTIDIGENAGAA